jgi:type IV secretory pathway TraG/TraD family ATPase VirD4
VIAPPGYGKTSGVIVPNVLSWDGPVISTSTRGDVLHATGNRRHHIASSRTGKVYVYDPLGSEAGLTSIGWSPFAGCEDSRVCFRRVASITSTAGDGLTDGKHWRLGAAAILRGYFQAAAIGQLPMSTVRSWIARQEVNEPVEILRSDDRGVEAWAQDLESMPLLGERERGSFYSVCRAALEATAEPTVLESCDLPTLDIDEFLHSKSTLYVVGPIHYQDVTAPLIVGLLDSIIQRAAELAARNADGALKDPLLNALDEIANVAPLRTLPALVSELGGRGVATIWAAQTLARMRVRYGTDETQAILSATTAKLVYGGVSSDTDLRNISGWAGEHREHQLTVYTGHDPRTAGTDAQGQHAIGYQYRPSLPIEAIQQLPRFHAWLFYRSDPPLMVQTPPAGLLPVYARLGGYTPSQELKAP